MTRKSRSNQPINIDNLKHDDTRKNIPTAETSDFMTDEDREGFSAQYPRYRRDPALDPQLVWNGKDEEDHDDLQVLVRPIYVHEKIHPRAIVEAVRAEAKQDAPLQMSLFDDFNGISFEDAIDFYQHDQHWTNRMILGDSLAVMASLTEKEGLRGKVQMIYIDPPYGIKFNSNWQPSTVKRDVKDGRDVTYEPEQIRAFRDTWERGIHSYLSYLRDRLRVARELLTDSGSIFVQIGDENVHLVRNLLDEVFGAENFVALISYRTKNMTLEGNSIATICDYIIWYSKNRTQAKIRPLFQFTDTQGDTHWNRVIRPDGTKENITTEELNNPKSISGDSEVYQLAALYPVGYSENRVYEFSFQGKVYRPASGRSWKASPEGMSRLEKADRLEPYSSGDTIRYILKLNDYPVSPIHNMWTETPPPSDKIYVVQTSNVAIQRCMLMTTDPGDLVLDPTCGSGTTAYVAEQWGRRWVTMDTSRVALALARTRLMAARYPAYKLKTEHVRDGFIYKTVPHITLKSIANNAQIDVIHARYQPTLDDLRARINAQAGATWEEWEVPRPNPDAVPSPLQDLLAEYWAQRRERQQQMDNVIRDSADQEILYDQPEVDNRVVRVSGPFTVESLSPHRSEDARLSSASAKNGSTFAQDMLEQLRESGVTNARRGERLQFTALDAHPGRHIHALGTYEQGGQSGRAAVFIGPQYGTVSKDMLKEAAKEAVRGDAVDMLIVCGFAFDPSVSEETRSYGRLVVQTARISPDLLLMGKDLKKDGKGNLFTVFGEPDVRMQTLADGRIVVQLLGVDVYDPSSSKVRSSSTDEIACWFIDTQYNGESFFVRHAYFTGADKPYEKLQRALRAEIDPEAWESLYKTESLPIERPSTGRIAVKVINHHGDEVMSVFTV